MIGRPVFAFVAISLVAGAATNGRYGDTLLAQAAHRAGEAGLRIDALGADGTPIVVGEPIAGGASVPLCDAMGKRIGTLTVSARLRARSRGIAAWLERRIYVVDNLAEPDPFVAGATRFPYAQALVERSLARFPDLVTLALHVAPAGGTNTIIASNFGRIGKRGDNDDLQIEQKGGVRREVTNDGHRLAVELPLLDTTGHAIGALSTSFVVPKGADPQSLYSRAVAVRDTLARHIASRAALFAK